MISHIRYLIYKEFLLEWRQKYALGGVLLYVFATVFVCYLSFKRVVDIPAWNALFWIIVLFAAMKGVAKSFVQESHGRQIYYYTLASPQAIIVSKIIYNALLAVVLAIVSWFIYSLLIGSRVQDLPLFMVTVVLGSIGISALLTFISAIAAKAGQNLTLMAILSFPLLLPVLILIMALSKNAIDGLQWSVSYKYIFSLGAMDIVVITLSYILFPYLWTD